MFAFLHFLSKGGRRRREFECDIRIHRRDYVLQSKSRIDIINDNTLIILIISDILPYFKFEPSSILQ